MLLRTHRCMTFCHLGTAPVAAAIALAMTQASFAQESAQQTCRLEVIGTAKVTAVRDGRTSLLADGREARLAGIETPRAGDAAAPAAKTALENLIAGQTITLKRLGPPEDRYGRLLVFAFASEGGSHPSLQHALLAAGHARMAARIGDRTCAAELLSAERAAREAKLGLWTDPAYGPRQAGNPAEVLSQRGRFTVVEGKVLSVREAGSTIYVNFGRRWTRDFTVTILKRNERTFSAAGLEPKKLEGRRVRVRGWIEQRGGPILEATRPEQIEIAELN